MTADGFYLYGVCEEDGGDDPRWAGIAGLPVCAVRRGAIIALGHRCAARPYASADEVEALAWIAAHDGVLQAALGRYCAVVPLRFNTIVRADGVPPARAVETWLGDRAGELRGALARVRGCVEFAVRLRRPAGAEPPPAPDAAPGPGPGPGTAFLRREVWAREARRAAVSDAEAVAERCLAPLRACAREVQVADTAADARTVVRCACLVPRTEVSDFAAALDAVAAAQGLELEATGPWPAYSFAG